MHCLIYLSVTTWKLGGGNGGTEQYVGRLSNKEECVDRCRSRSKNGVPANGATVDWATQRMCYCQFGQTSQNNDSSLMTRHIIPCEIIFVVSKKNSTSYDVTCSYKNLSLE